jgi:hypothetical protein
MSAGAELEFNSGHTSLYGEQNGIRRDAIAPRFPSLDLDWPTGPVKDPDSNLT